MADYRGVMIGCGGRAGGHADAYVKASGVEMVAVADMDEAKADAFAQKYGVTRYYDAEEMLDKESPDIVTVCTREEPRCALTIAAAERGAKGIVAEKPMAANIAEARQMVETCERTGTLLTVSHQMRFCDEFIAARDAIARGDVGQVYYIRASCYGQLMEQGPHMIDMILWLAGDPEVEWVMGQVADLEAGLETVHIAPAFVVGYITFANGIRAVIESGRIFQKAVGLEDETWLQKRVQVLGTDGVVDTIVAHYCQMMNARAAGWQELYAGSEGWDLATIKYYQELVDVLNHGGERRNGPEPSLRGFELVHSIYQSALTGDRFAPPLPADADPLNEIMSKVR